MSVNWIDFPDSRFEVNGLAFFEENKPDLFRFPKRVRTTVRPEVWELAEAPSGGRIRFATDSTQLHIKLRYSKLIQMFNMCRFGQAGVDVSVDGQFWNIISPASDGTAEYVLFSGVMQKVRQICLYLPLYHPVEVLAIGFDKTADIAGAKPYKDVKPIVYYGSSILQGGCSSRPSLSYTAILSRIMDIDFVNFGFSGQGKGDPEVAQLIAGVQASCYVMDFAQNVSTAEGLAKVYLPFLETVHASNPQTPIVCITSIFDDREFHDKTLIEKNLAQRQVIRDAVAKFNKKYEKPVTLIEGQALIGRSSSEAFVDGVHPNDLGFVEMARNLEPLLRAILNE